MPDSIKLIKSKDRTLETSGLYKGDPSPAKTSQGLQLASTVISIVMEIESPPCGIQCHPGDSIRTELEDIHPEPRQNQQASFWCIGKTHLLFDHGYLLCCQCCKRRGQIGTLLFSHTCSFFPVLKIFLRTAGNSFSASYLSSVGSIGTSNK